MKPNKFRPGVFRWDDDLDPEKNERVKRDVENAMKPIVEINSEIKSKFTNLQAFISDMIDQNIKLMKNTCERQLNGYKSQKRRLKGFIDRNCLVFESQPDVVSLQTEIHGLRSKVSKLEERALYMQSSYETSRKIAYEKHEIVKALRKGVRESHRNTLDTKYQVYNHAAKYLLLRYNITPQPKTTPRLHKRSHSSQYSPRELQNLPYLVPKQLDSYQLSEYLNLKQTVNILKSQIESKRREVHSLTLSNGANSYLTFKTDEFLLDCLASISKIYGMYKHVNQARYNERNILDTPSSLSSPCKKPSYMSWSEFGSKSPRDLLKMLEKYPIILKILKQSVTNSELLRKDDVPYNTSISPLDNAANLESLYWELPDISL